MKVIRKLVMYSKAPSTRDTEIGYSVLFFSQVETEVKSALSLERVVVALYHVSVTHKYALVQVVV